MTFYNPFFPQFPRMPMPKSTNTTQNVDNCNNTNNITQTSNSSNNSKCNSRTSVSKVYQNFFKSQVPLQNYLKETDTLIILGLLFLLYTQETKDFSLMLCLFLLLFDN